MIDHQLNTALPQIMWIDLNSAFATTEQQAHISLRHRPVGIANRISPECCIIAASYEAKALGVRTGMRRTEALRRCPDLVLLESDPAKYRAVYDQLYRIMQSYSDRCGMKSIDEGYIDLTKTTYNTIDKLTALGYEIKQRVKSEIGDYMTINVGLGPNRFLAKLAAGLHKPDGMDILHHQNLVKVYRQLQLEDLTGIAQQLGRRLRRAGINTPIDFLEAPEPLLRLTVFRSINGTYWYQRLRGYEVDDHQTNLSMIGRQWIVDCNGDDDEYLSSCLHFLTETVGLKLRFRDVRARGVCVWLRFQAGSRYSKKYLANTPFNDNATIWQIANQLFQARPAGRIVCMGVYLYNFTTQNHNQLAMLNDARRNHKLTTVVDQINQRFGVYTVHSAHSNDGANHIEQKVPFGGTNYLGLLIE